METEKLKIGETEELKTPLDVGECQAIWLALNKTRSERVITFCAAEVKNPIEEAEDELYLALTRRLSQACLLVSITSSLSENLPTEK